jgi:glycosyltransferase involved in cell wall biosynthesis
MTPILLFCQDLEAGSRTAGQLRLLAGQLRAENFAPLVGCFRASPAVADSLRQLGLDVQVFPKNPLAVRRYLQSSGATLLHTFDPASNGLLAPFSPVRVVQSVDRPLDELPPWQRVALRANAAVFVPTQELLDVHPHAYALPDAVDPDTYPFLDRQRPAWLEPAGLLIGSTLPAEPASDLPTLLEAFRRVLDARDGLLLVLTGSGSQLPLLRSQAAEGNLPVLFAGSEDCSEALTSSLMNLTRATRHAVERTPSLAFQPARVNVKPEGSGEAAGLQPPPVSWLQAFDVFVDSSRSGCLSTPLLRAMATANAVIATQRPEHAALVEHNENGLLYTPGQAPELATHLRMYILDQRLRAQYSGRASRCTHDRHSPRKVATALAAGYREVLSRTR